MKRLSNEPFNRVEIKWIKEFKDKEEKRKFVPSNRYKELEKEIEHKGLTHELARAILNLPNSIVLTFRPDSYIKYD